MTGGNKAVKDDEIDLVDLVKHLWLARKFVIKITSFFVSIGLLIAITSKDEYEASCRLLPESHDGSSIDLGGLGGLASLAGIDVPGFGSAQAIPPVLYPELAGSTPFLDTLFNTQIYFEKIDTTVSSHYYFKEIAQSSVFDFLLEYTLGLPGKIKDVLKSETDIESSKLSNISRYSKEEWKMIESFSKRLSVSFDDETGIIFIATEMPDPMAAAMLTNSLVDELTESVTNYRLEKSSVNFEFINDRFGEAKIEYKQKQEQLARFTNRNRNISNAIIQTEYERLQNELDISFEVYKGLATQLEQAKIKIKEETPIFTILEPVKIPEEKSKPRRLLILSGVTFLGFTLGLSYVIVKYALLQKWEAISGN